MPRSLHRIDRNDLLPPAEYARQRVERRKAMMLLKRDRRLAIGPDATACFESYDTMWHQIHEMLFIEKGGEARIEDELRAYNPLVPNGRELVVTLMFEIGDPGRRARILAGLGGVERTLALDFAGHRISARPEDDVERTTPEGKTSAVHFLHFPFTEEQVAAFRDPANRVAMAIAHPRYGHRAILPETVRVAVAADFD